MQPWRCASAVDERVRHGVGPLTLFQQLASKAWSLDVASW